MNKEVKEIFIPGPIVSLLMARKLGSYLVSAKLYPLERSVGSFQYNGKQRQVCLNIKETKTFSSTVTTKEYRISHRLTWLRTISACFSMSEKLWTNFGLDGISTR